LLCLRSGWPFQLLEVQGLSYCYPDGHQAIQDLNFQIGRGERVAVLGANGAGKSTLLLQLTGVSKGEGNFLIDGKPLPDVDLSSLRRVVGLVFQNPDDQLFCSTVEEDVAYGLRCQGIPEDEVARKVEKALQAVDMLSAKERFPQNLSGGEKKRVALASILVMEPQVLILDEPTSGLDARARRSILDTLHQLETAFLMATHDLQMALETTTRALVLDSGRLVFDGSTTDLLKDDEALFRYGLKA
jgi:cobalt/nickel transport system ATP-binding protein